MKAFKILVCALMFASVSVYAADKDSKHVPLAQKNHQNQAKKAKEAGYTWQDCVDDYTQESGYTRKEAYAQCESLQ